MLKKCKPALLAALLAGIIAIPFLGLKLEFGALVQDWPTVGLVMLIAFVASLLWPTIPKKNIPPEHSTHLPKWEGWTLPLMLVAALALPFTQDALWLDRGILILLSIMLAWGLSITVGLAGLLDMGFIAFYALGAYTFGLLSLNAGLSLWLCLPIAAIVAASMAVVVGFPSLRLRGDYLAIVTLGFAEITRIIITNWQSLTGGSNGLTGLPKPSLFGVAFERTAPDGMVAIHEFLGIEYSPLLRLYFFYGLILLLVIGTYYLIRRLRRLPIGRAWEALREDDIACRALGLPIARLRLSAYALGGAIAGVAGCLFAARQGVISPESFTFQETALILAIVVLGGMSNLAAIALAAVVLVLLPELLREGAEYRMLLFGLALILMMRWRPQGLIAARKPSVKVSYWKVADGSW